MKSSEILYMFKLVSGDRKGNLSETIAAGYDFNSLSEKLKENNPKIKWVGVLESEPFSLDTVNKYFTPEGP